MKITHSNLENSRCLYRATIPAEEVEIYYQRAVNSLSKNVKVSGFRPGKAPDHIVKQQLDSSVIREEAYSLAVQSVWRQIMEELTVSPIQDPEVEVKEFEEGKEAVLEFAFDIRPEVKVKDWQKISIKPIEPEKVGDGEVGEVITSLSRSNAKEIIKLEPADKEDKVEVTFTGAIGGVRKDSLSANNFPIVLGQGSVLPGFEENIMGMKRGDAKEFEVEFPSTHYDKELAGKKVKFEVKIEEVYKLVLPEQDEEFAKKFGHPDMATLRKAIREDLENQKREEANNQQKAKYLAEFEKTIATALPETLIRSEIDRSKQHWQMFLAERGLNPQEWLARRGTTLEEMEKDWRKAAESSVKIGLGLSEVAKEKGKELKEDMDYQTLLNELTESAVSKK